MRFNLPLAALSAVAASTFALPSLSAQTAKPAPRPVEPGGMVWTTGAPGSLIWTTAANRAVLGVTLAVSSRSDTAGVRIDEVDSAGPASKAGIKSGDVITEINGVNLRVSAADADDPALAGIAQRRLQRTLSKAKPGDDVNLRVRTGSAAPRAVTVKTVSAADLDGKHVATTRIRTSANDDDAAIGVSISASGNNRDTLGLFVSSVVNDGPADKAGLIEGERIAAVNGVDVRIPKEDFEDMSATSARMNRFTREVQKVAAGGTVTLRVYGNGRYREVAVKTVKRSELPHGGMAWSIGDGALQMLPGRAMIAPKLQFGPSLNGVMIRPGGQVRIRTDNNDFEYNYNGEDVQKAMELVREKMDKLQKELKVEVKAGTVSRRAITHM